MKTNLVATFLALLATSVLAAGPGGGPGGGGFIPGGGGNQPGGGASSYFTFDKFLVPATTNSSKCVGRERVWTGWAAGITAATLNSSVNKLASGVCAGCTTLTSVDLSACTSLVEIPDSAFAGCTALTTVVLPSSCVTIGPNAFAGCTKLSSITGVGVTTVGTDAFHGCAALTSGTLGQSTLPPAIGGYAYAQSGLTEVDISEVSSLGAGAFSGCANLTVAIVAAEASLPEAIFAGCSENLVITYLGGTVNSAVIFDANGGQFSDGATKRHVEATPGNLWGKMPMPSLAGYVFDGFYTEAEGGDLVTASSVVPNADATYYAHWTPRLGLAAASEWTGEFTTDSWCGQGTVTHDGRDALRSGIIYDGQNSYLMTKVTGEGVLTFWWAVSCEAGGKDALRLLVDGSQVEMISGDVDWRQVAVEISGTGTHTIKWNYTKNGSVTKGEDFGWIDQIVWTSDSTTVIFDANGGQFSDGATKRHVEATPGNLWGKMPMPSLAGYVFDGFYTEAEGGEIVTASSMVPNADATYYAHWTPRLGLAAASEWTREFTTDSWCGQGTVTHDGKDALRSGIIYDGQNSYLLTKVTGEGTLAFWWAVSCEAGGNDALRLLVDGVQVKMISGETDWAKVTVDLTGSDTHVIKWNYTKNASVTKGEDFGWLDQITWTPAE